MRRVLSLVVLLAASVICTEHARAQESLPRGSNYDPPPPPVAKTAPVEPPAAEPEQSFFGFGQIDWADSSTYVKVALLVGSVLLARRAFREMKGDF